MEDKKVKTWEELMKKHGMEIRTYEMSGQNTGRLMYAMAILSDVEHMITPSVAPIKAVDEIEEAKLIMSKVIRDLGELKKVI